jgi:hypothetical protein
VAAQPGALTLKIAYERWSDAANGDEFNEVARRTLTELQAASATCCSATAAARTGALLTA